MSSERASLLWLGSGALVLLGVAIGWTVYARRSHTSAAEYLLGTAAWLVAVVLKLFPGTLIFAALDALFRNRTPEVITLVATGLLTAVVECGVTLGFRLPHFNSASHTSAVAFGLGFGGTEAALLAVLAVLTGIAGLSIDSLGPAEAREIQTAVSDWPKALCFMPERASALAVHMLACVLIVRAVRTRQWRWFWGAFALKGLIDALPAPTTGSSLGTEAGYLLLGAASLAALLRLDRGPADARGVPERGGASTQA